MNELEIRGAIARVRQDLKSYVDEGERQDVELLLSCAEGMVEVLMMYEKDVCLKDIKLELTSPRQRGMRKEMT